MRHGSILFVVLLLLVGGWLSTSFADLHDWILADDFETGLIDAWTETAGPVAVMPDAASDGAFGLRVLAETGEPAWVRDDSPSDDTIVRTDFDVNFDGLAMMEGDTFDLYAGYVTYDTEPAFIITLERLGGQFNISLTGWAEGGMVVVSAPQPIPGSGWHRMAVEFKAAESAEPEGQLRVFVDGSLVNLLADFHNQGFDVNSLQLGTIGGINPTTSGSFDIDVYTSVRLFNPWPCATSGGGDPADGQPLCLDVEGKTASIAVGGCGDGVVVWRGAEDLDISRGRIGGIYGKPVRGTSRQTTDTFAIIQDEFARTPSVDMDAGCNSALAWSSSFSGEAVYTAVFDVDGMPLTPQVQVSEGTEAEEWPVVAADDDGRYLVVWRRIHAGESSIHGRFYEADATPVAQEFSIDPGTFPVSLPDAAMNGGGRAAVVWESSGTVMVHLFDEAGASLGVTALTLGPMDGQPAVAVFPDGNFVVVWARLEPDWRIYLRTFDPDGVPISPEILVDDLDPADCAEPDVDVGPDNEIVVLWSSTNGGLTSILGRNFDPDGTPISGPFQLENQGRVWLPVVPRVAAAERLLFSYSAETDYYGYSRGSLVGARSVSAIFTDGFELGDLSEWSDWTP